MYIPLKFFSQAINFIRISPKLCINCEIFDVIHILKYAYLKFALNLPARAPPLNVALTRFPLLCIYLGSAFPKISSQVHLADLM